MLQRPADNAAGSDQRGIARYGIIIIGERYRDRDRVTGWSTVFVVLSVFRSIAGRADVRTGGGETTAVHFSARSLHSPRRFIFCPAFVREKRKNQNATPR